MGVRSFLLVTAALVGALLPPRFALAQTQWESQIQAYEAADRARPPPLGSVVITGSSTIARWTTIQTDLAPLDIIPRGFGGSTADDLDYYLQRIVLVYKPRAVVIYEGDNDIVNGQSPTYVANRIAGILARITAALPYARVYVISIKPSPARVQWAAAESSANQLLAALCATDARYTYIDTASRLVNSSGTPIPDYFISDGVHLTTLGYQVWTAAIRPVLLPQLQIPMPADSVPPTAPTGLTAAAQSSSRIDLNWRAASDSGSGLAGYSVFRNGRSIASITAIYLFRHGPRGEHAVYLHGDGIRPHEPEPQRIATVGCRERDDADGTYAAPDRVAAGEPEQRSDRRHHATLLDEHERDFVHRVGWVGRRTGAERQRYQQRTLDEHNVYADLHWPGRYGE